MRVIWSFTKWFSPEVKKLLQIMCPYRKQFLYMVLCMVFSSGIFFLLPLLTKDIMDKGLILKDKQVVFQIATYLIILFTLQQVAELLKERMRTKLKSKIIINLYEKAFAHIYKIKIDYLPSNTAKLYNQIQSDITNIATIADNATFFILIQILNVIGGIIGLFFIRWEMGLIILLFVPIKYILIKYYSKCRKKLSKELLRNNSYFAEWFENTVLGIKELKMFQLGEIKQNELKIFQQRNTSIERQINMYTAYNLASDYLLTNFLSTLVYVLGIYFILADSMSIGSIVAFATYIMYVTAPISSILNIKFILAGIIPSTKRYFDFIDEPEEIFQGINTLEEESHNKMWTFRIEDITYEYLNTNVVVFSNITFQINQGDKIALIGNNGSGKTTFLHLLLRFYDVNRGAIYLNSNDIRLYNLSDYRNIFSFVDQNVYLFDASIKENIILNQEYDEIRFGEIIRLLNMEPLINNKKEYITIGTNGKNLSGGEKQKIALARAIYQEREIYIFDEITSNLDSITKNIFVDLLQTYFKDKTVIIITHDKEVLSYIDKTYCFNNGRLKLLR